MWKRGLHTNKDDGLRTERSSDPLRSGKDVSSLRDQKNTDSEVCSEKGKSRESTHGGHYEGFTRSHLMNRLPHMSHLHRPTKEELLAAANGFWSRLKVRFKWFSIRSVRPFNFDEITALFSWVLLGHVVWIVLGTTTFFSLLIIAINTVMAQGMFKAGVDHNLENTSNTDVYRNLGWMGRKLPYKVIGSEGCFRICYRS